jgi:CHASE3 domain sensor protein
MIAGSAVIFGVHRINRMAESQEAIGDELFAARRVYETLLSMESSQRGYLLTADATYLDPYLRDACDIDGAMSHFENLFRQDDAADATVDTIRDLARVKQAELTQTFSADFTDWLSRTAADGLASRPIRSRSAICSSAQIASQVPSRWNLRKML